MPGEARHIGYPPPGYRSSVLPDGPALGEAGDLAQVLPGRSGISIDRVDWSAALGFKGKPERIDFAIHSQKSSRCHTAFFRIRVRRPVRKRGATTNHAGAVVNGAAQGGTCIGHRLDVPTYR